MKDRLIELIGKLQNEGRLYDEANEVAYSIDNSQLAEFLLQNGVIVPPCKVGDDVYWIDTEEETVQCAKKDIKAVVYCGNDRFQVITGGMVEPEDIHTDWCMLTEEEANKRLLERSKT